MASSSYKAQQRRKAHRNRSKMIRLSEARFPGLLSLVNAAAIQGGQLVRRADGVALNAEEQIVWEVARGLLYDEEV